MMRRWMVCGMLIVLVLSVMPAWAQLVSVEKEYRIRKVDVARHRLEVTSPSKEDPVLFVQVDGYTQVLKGQQLVAWKELQPGTVVQVKGGLTMDLKIKARTIIIPPAP